MDNKVSIHFGEDKTKYILFASKRRSKKVHQLNIRYNHINIKQHSQVTHLECMLDETCESQVTHLPCMLDETCESQVTHLPCMLDETCESQVTHLPCMLDETCESQVTHLPCMLDETCESQVTHLPCMLDETCESQVTHLPCMLDETCETIALKVINKINGKLKLLYRKNRYLTKKLRSMLCNAFIQTHFDYTCPARYPISMKK